MKKRELLAVAAEVEARDASAAEDLRAVAEYAVNDEAREVLADYECTRLFRERRYDAAEALWAALHPAAMALYRL